jgi:hypothetical protein
VLKDVSSLLLSCARQVASSIRRCVVNSVFPAPVLQTPIGRATRPGMSMPWGYINDLKTVKIERFSGEMSKNDSNPLPQRTFLATC